MDLPDAQQIRDMLSRLNPSENNLESQTLRQTQLVRNGHFYGQRFELGSLKAIWSVDCQIVQICDAAGNKIQSVPLTSVTSTDTESETRRAA